MTGKDINIGLDSSQLTCYIKSGPKFTSVVGSTLLFIHKIHRAVHTNMFTHSKYTDTQIPAGNTFA